jgi:hypothetical protein
LLHVRLRAVTFLLSAGLALVLARDLAFGRGPDWPLQTTAIVAMTFLAALLTSSPRCPARTLRAMEVAAFGLAAAVVAIHLWHAHLSAARGDYTSLAEGSKDAVIGTTIVMFSYAMLVPAPPGAHWTEFSRGQHFPAMEAPARLAADLKAFFGPLRLPP